MSTSTGTYTKRGKGNCPNCSESYSCRYKPETCSKCGCHLGGSFQAKNAKRAKNICPDVVRITPSIYSTKTSTKDDRCFVVSEGEDIICLHNNCKLLRSTCSATGNIETRCKHVQSIEAIPTAMESSETSYWLSEEKINQYAGGKVAKEMLTGLLSTIPEGHPSVVRVTQSKFAVYGKPTATNTIGYCHVHIECEERRIFKCTSKGCKTYVSNSKQAKVRVTCQHLHVIYCLVFNNDPAPLKEATFEDNPTGTDDTPITPATRVNTLDAAMSRSLPYEIPSALIHQISKRDAASLLGEY